MTRKELVNLINTKQSFLCVGLDSDPLKLPAHLRSAKDAILEFNEQIIRATAPYTVAYKINTAFYEALGAKGWEIISDTLDLIPDDFFVIADAKRGDIGNTSASYAKTFFETYDFDAVTVTPYMGEDSVAPFLEYENKWTILLALTSNNGSADFQMIKDSDGVAVYQHVLRKSMQWAGPEKLMYVVGATHPQEFASIRKMVPDHFLLVPGIGAQGGDLESIVKYAMNDDVGLLVNASRSIIFAGEGTGFAEAAAREAGTLRSRMAQLLKTG